MVRLLLVLLGATVAAVYWPGLGGAYVFDDFANIVDNEALRLSWHSDWRQWLDAALSSPSSDLPRPLAYLSFAFNHAWTGLDPFWMKLTNLGIHLLNSLLVFGLTRAVLRAAGCASAQAQIIAVWIAAIWALNPINFMAVLFVVQRMESLCHTFVFAGLWFYLSARLRLLDAGVGWLRMGVGIVAGAGLGVLVKESAALLPLYALLLEWALLRGRSLHRSQDRRMWVFFALVFALPVAIAMSRMVPRALQSNAYDGRNFDLIERLLTEARVLIDYVQWTLLPNLSQVSLYHDDYPVSRGLLAPPSTLFALLLLAAVLFVALWLRNRRPLVSLGIAWFLGAHALTAGIWPLELVFEHRNYFASLGLCLILGDLLLRLPTQGPTRRAGWAAAIAALVFYTGTTALRSREWSDQMRFSVAEATKHPNSPRATYDVARNLVILTDFRADSPHFEPALDALNQAMQAPNATPLPESAAILLAARAGTPIHPEWWRSMKGKLDTRPIGLAEIGALSTLADCEIEGYCRLPQAEMVDAFLTALEDEPHPQMLHVYGSYALNALHDPTLALILFQDAVQRAPREVAYRLALARLLIASGRASEATPHIEQLSRLGRLGQYRALADDLRRQAQQAPLTTFPAPATAKPSMPFATRSG